MRCPICHRPVRAMTQERAPVKRPAGSPPWGPIMVTIYTHDRGQCRVVETVGR